MRIVIDLQGAQSESRHRGIGRHTSALVQAFARLACERHELWIVANAQLGHIDEIKAAFGNYVPVDRIVAFTIPSPVAAMDASNLPRADAAELVRENVLRDLSPDIVWTSSLFEGWVDDTVTSIGRLPMDCLQVVTLYDLIPLSDKDRHLSNPEVCQWYFRKLSYLERADALLAISEYARNEAIDLLDIAPERVHTISSAVESQFRVLNEIERQRLDTFGYPDKPFVLYFGGYDDRKNVELLVRAYAKMPKEVRSGHYLMLAGKITPTQESTLRSFSATLGLSDGEVQFTGRISDEQLVVLCNRCSLFVFPSLQEGFGLPVLEAMACGAPVLAANATSLPEVVGREDMLFDPVDAVGLANKMAAVLQDAALSEALRAHGLAQSRKFSWGASAQRVLDAFESIEKRRQSDNRRPSISSHRPRLAFVSPLPPERSGIADYSAELLPSLARHYDIDVVVSQDEVTDPWVLSNYPVRSVAWFSDHADQFDRILYHFGNSAFHLHQFELMRRHPGTVVMHDSFIGALSRWRAIHAGSDQPYLQRLYQSHGYRALVDDHVKGRDWTAQNYPSSWEVLEHAAGVLVHSRYAIEQVRHFYGEHGAREMRRIPFPKRRRSEVREESRRSLGIAPNDFVVCSFGMVAPTKLNDRLLSAWLKSSLSSDAQCHLVFVGENHGAQYGSDLQAAMRSSDSSARIRITGFVDEAKYHAWLEAADLAVQLRSESRGETSAAVFDCLAQGVPVVVNAHATFAELDRDAVMMVPDDFRDDQLVDAIQSLYSHPERRQMMVARARQLIDTDHHHSQVSEQYAEAIEYFAKHHVLSLERELGRALADVPNMSDGDLWKVAAAIRHNRRPHCRATIFVDVTAVVRADHKTGIERVTRNIARQMLLSETIEARVELVRFAGGGYVYARDYACALLDIPSLELPEEPIDIASGDMFFGLDWVADIVPSNQALFESWRDRGVSVHFMVYDLLPVLRPEFFPPGIEGMHANWLRSIGVCADGLVCISKTVAGELSHWLAAQRVPRVTPLRIGYSYLGAELEVVRAPIDVASIGPQSAEVVDCMRINRALLMVGTIEPRKGHKQALDAFECLWASGSDIQLVIVGKLGWMMDDLEKRIESHPEYGRRLHWLRGINDDELRAVYAAAKGLLVASEGEGFGLPIIEAASYGIPVIARDIPIFREVAGDNVGYFSGNSGDELAAAIRHWLERRELHATSPGELAIKVLSWVESAETVGAMLSDTKHVNWLINGASSENLSLTLKGRGLSLDMRHISGEFLGAGWSLAEDWGRWAIGPEARISIDLNMAESLSLTLSMEADALLCEGLPRQRFGIKVNGELLGQWVQELGQPAPALRWIVPSAIVEGRNRLDIDLVQVDAVSPAALGLSEDERILGLAVRKIELRPSGPS